MNAVRLVRSAVSTHTHLPDGDEAERCTRLGYIAYGEMLAQGTAQELLQRFGIERLEDVFIEVMKDLKDLR